MEYRHWVLHYFGKTQDRIRDRSRDVDQYFSNSFGYWRLAPGEVLPEAEIEYPPEASDDEGGGEEIQDEPSSSGSEEVGTDMATRAD